MRLLMISVRTSAAAPFRISEGLDSKVKSNGMNLGRKPFLVTTNNKGHHSVKQGCAVLDLGKEEQWGTEQQGHLHDSTHRHVTTDHSIGLGPFCGLETAFD